MKYVFAFLTIFYSGFIFAQKIVKIEIHSIPLGILTDSRVKCDENFDYDFEKVLFIKKIVNQNEIKTLEKELQILQKERPNRIDVRGFIIINYESKKVRKICFDHFGHFCEKDKYFKGDSVLNFLKRNKYIKT